MKSSVISHIEYSKDPIAFMDNKWFGYDVFEKHTLTKLNPMKFQMRFIEKIHKNKFSLVAHSRQMHVTSMMALYIAWYALFNDNKTIFIVSDSIASGKHLLNSIAFILDNYQVDGYGRFISAERSKDLTLYNGSKIYVRSATLDAGRGFGIDLLYVHNAAQMKYFEDIFLSLLPCLYHRTDSKFIISSTPKNNSYFNKFFLDTSEGYEWEKIQLNWKNHPVYSEGIYKTDDLSEYEYSSPWFEKTCRHLCSKEIIEQELECIITYQDKTNKSKTISLRLEQDVYNKIVENITKDKNVSDYIRDLINKDLSN